MNPLTLTLLTAVFSVSMFYVRPASPAAIGTISYEEYMSLMRRKVQQQEQVLQRERRRTIERRPTCNLFPAYLEVTEEDCVGYIPIFGCAGTCLSTVTPPAYNTR